MRGQIDQPNARDLVAPKTQKVFEAKVVRDEDSCG